MSYTQYGPFTNGTSPGISATFLNNVETFLLSLNSASYDANITSDGSGNITAIGTIKFNGSNAKLMIASGSSILDATLGTNLILNAPNTGGGHKVYLQVGGNSVMSVDANGTIIYKTGGSAPAAGTP